MSKDQVVTFSSVGWMKEYGGKENYMVKEPTLVMV